MKRRKKFFILFSSIFFLVIAVGLATAFISIRAVVREQFGPPASSLSLVQQVIYPFELFIHRANLVTAADLSESTQTFTIETGESISMVCLRLENAGLISDAELMRTYLIYSGLDRQLQSGQFQLSAAMSPVQIAAELLEAAPKDAVVTILPGWRIEEVAANVAASGLPFSPQDFTQSAYAAPRDWLSILPVNEIFSLEGFLFPGTYVFSRDSSVDVVFGEILAEFTGQVDQSLIDGFSRQGLALYDAVKLASIVEREAVVDEEKPMIASVFYNRLAAGMRLETDPTVQYALGFQEDVGTWWKAPLSTADLTIDSPYNTYIVYGLPPTPISSPGKDSLRAVAFPAETPYYFFRAACDGSGRHHFAITYEEHLNNACE